VFSGTLRISLHFWFICVLIFLSFRVNFCFTNPEYVLIRVISPPSNYSGLARVYCTTWHSFQDLKAMKLVGFEVVTPVVIKCSIFWDITPCSSFKVNRCIGETCRIHLQGQVLSSTCYLLHAGFLLGSFFDHEWTRHVSPKHRWTFNVLHGIIS
jgi:hypothetical protein